MTTNDEESVDSAEVRLAAMRLANIAPGDSPEALLDALEPCLGVAAGLLMAVKPGSRTTGSRTTVTHHALRLPMPLLEKWMHTQPDYLEESLEPAVRSDPGDFWSAHEDLSEKLQRNMEVLHVFDQFGLGEGAGLKLLRQPTLGGGEEHVLMAIMTHRMRRFPRQTSAICRQLAPALQDAIVRLGLPFTVGQSIHAQMHEADDVGFVCLGAGGAIVELNQRAYELAARYREVAGIRPSRTLMHDFVAAARKKMLGGPVWYLMHPSGSAMMQVRMYVMPMEKFALSRDLPMIKLQEWSWPSPDPFASLPPRQREIANLLVSSGLATKEIADKLEISPATVRKHVEKIHKALNVRSLGELVALALKYRN